MSDARGTGFVGWVSSVVAYIAGGIGFRSRSGIELLLKLMSLGWAFVAGGFGLILGMMDYGPGVAALFAVYAGAGLVFGMLNPRYWMLAAFCAWGVVLMWLSLAPFRLLGLAASAFGLTASDYGQELWQLATMVILPLVGAIAGSFAGMRVRRWIGPRLARALGPEQS